MPYLELAESSRGSGVAGESVRQFVADAQPHPGAAAGAPRQRGRVARLLGLQSRPVEVPVEPQGQRRSGGTHLQLGLGTLKGGEGGQELRKGQSNWGSPQGEKRAHQGQGEGSRTGATRPPPNSPTPRWEPSPNSGPDADGWDHPSPELQSRSGPPAQSPEQDEHGVVHALQDHAHQETQPPHKGGDQVVHGWRGPSRRTRGTHLLPLSR